METSEDVLVIILASALAVFLILAIIAAVKAIQILNRLKRISDTAEIIAEKAQSFTETFAKTAAPVAVGRVISKIVGNFFSKQKDDGKRKKNA